jgi:hypothetical protein
MLCCSCGKKQEKKLAKKGEKNLANRHKTIGGFCDYRGEYRRGYTMSTGGAAMTTGMGIVFLILAVSGLVRLVIDVIEIRDRLKS